MKLGIMQPYFFPYLEYFRLISACDMWIGFDTVKYSRKSWMNRNRILNRDKDWSYIYVPVVHSEVTMTVATALVDEGRDWRKELFDKLRVYESTAPNYRETIELLRDILDNDFATLADLNMQVIRRIGKRLGVNTRIERLSELKLDLPDTCPPGEWALRIAQEVGATSYLNASGGRDLFDANLYRASGVPLSFHEHIDLKYSTGPFRFIPDLSIVDTFMWVDHDCLGKVVRGDTSVQHAADLSVPFNH